MYKKNNDGSFDVRSRSNPDKVYHVNASITTCKCPKFKFILRGIGSCHHMDEVKGGEVKVVKMEELPKGIVPFNASDYTQPLKQLDFIIKYGDHQYDYLIAKQEIILMNGMVRLLK